MDGPPYYNSTHYAVSPAQFSPANAPSRSAPTFSFNAAQRNSSSSHSNANWRESREEDAQNENDADFPPPPPPDFDSTMTSNHVVANTNAMHPANRLLLPARVAQPVTAHAANLPGPSPANALRYRVKTTAPSQQQQASARVSKNPIFHTVFSPANGFGDVRAFNNHYAQYAEVMDTLVQAELDRILRPTVRPAANKPPSAGPPQTPSRTVSQPPKNAPATPSRSVPPLNVQQHQPQGPAYPQTATTGAQRASVQNGNQSPQTAPIATLLAQSSSPMNNTARAQLPAQPIYAQPILLPQAGQNSHSQSNGFQNPAPFAAPNGVPPPAPNGQMNIASVAQSPRLPAGHRITAVAALPPTVPQSPSHSASRAVSSFPNAPPPSMQPQYATPPPITQKFVPPTPPTRRTSIQNSQTYNGSLANGANGANASPTAAPSVANNVPVMNGSPIAAATPQRITVNATNGLNATPARNAQMYNVNANPNANANANVTAAFADIDQMLTGLTAELDKMLDNEVVLRRKK